MDKYWSKGDLLRFDEIEGEFSICKILGTGASCVVYLTEYRDSHGNVLNCLLKEYNPRQLEVYRDESGWIEETEDDELFRAGLRRFEEGYRRQLEIRKIDSLTNVSTNIQGIYKKYGTEYIAMPCFTGNTYDDMEEDNLHSLFKRMGAIVKVIGQYHEKGFLHLDIKPGNIWILPETEEFVMLFDFDSVMRKEEVKDSHVVSSTLEWAAPEQLIPGRKNEICEATDIFALGEMIFYKLFRRHSGAGERQKDSVYDFEELKASHSNLDPAIWRKLAGLFRECLCEDISARISDASAVAAVIGELAELSSPRRHSIKTFFPTALNFFVGREDELKAMKNILAQENLLMLSGMGGIGKSELAKQYYFRNRDLYDVVIFAHQTKGLYSLFLDDQVFCITNMSPFKEEKETEEQYYRRKMKLFRDICNENVLVILDNIDEHYTDSKDMEVLNTLLSLPCKKIITTRLADWEYKSIEILPLEKEEELLQIFEHWCSLENEKERACAGEIIRLYAGYTLAIELIAKTITAGFMTPSEFWQQMQKKDTIWTKQRVRLFKDNDVKSDAGIKLISEVFSLGFLSEEHIKYLGIISLFGTGNLEVKLLREWITDFDSDILWELVNQGWIIRELNTTVKMHPVIVDVMRYKGCDTPELLVDLINNINTFVLEQWDKYCSVDESGTFTTGDYRKIVGAVGGLHATIRTQKKALEGLPELFHDLRKHVVMEDAEAKVEAICEKALSRIYGSNIPANIYVRYLEEMESIRRNKYGSILLIVHRVMETCRDGKGSVIVRGTWGNSLVVWLLGLSWSNPLSSDWRNSTYELPFGEIERLWGEGHVELNVAEESIEDICRAMESLEEVGEVRIESSRREKFLYLCPRGEIFRKYVREDDKLRLRDMWLYPVDFTEITLCPDEELSKLKELGITNDDIGRVDFSNQEIIKEMFAELPVEISMQLMYSEYSVSHEKIKEEITKCHSLLEVCPKNTLLDYVNAYGMLHGSHVWEHNQEELVRDGRRAWKDCFFYREDVYDYLLARGVEEERAFKIMNTVRKGMLRHAKFAYLLEGLDIPKDVVGIWKEIRYLFPVSHAVSYSIVRYMSLLHKKSE